MLQYAISNTQKGSSIMAKRAKLTSEALGILIRTGSVSRIELVHSLADGDWYIDAHHGDPALEAQLSTERGEPGRMRQFKTSDAALSHLRKLGYTGDLRIMYVT